MAFIEKSNKDIAREAGVLCVRKSISGAKQERIKSHRKAFVCLLVSKYKTKMHGTFIAGLY